ncbi:methyltransferase-like protein 7A isoform X2 [Homarus americanus]|uniref:Methyltransferase-like protein 7A-like 2 n=1 Tax=Homarus americanus TaxID=6706 RepID=A0A8J5JVP0_HOMAM|nr:methyltransferase-like protein 7A isoform X1 [Homarus americanus]XP_042237698.1 methyltransferase-like protein 7A isoform X2 [Homarus americanus]KAG7160119.1 Methyltransferase-like protein 7A-like 2 [Homarus americanus]
MSWLLTLGVIAVLIWLLKTFWPNIRQRYFAAFMNYYTTQPNPDMDKLKKDLFSPLGSLVSHDPELRKNNAIKILEIGVGTGVNFAYYPEKSRLVVVDPNPHFASYYNENRAKFPNIQSEEIIVSTAEEMDMVPDNSVDVVVSTLVFCSVGNTEKILQQILRVLTPGGKFIFFEHIREFDTERHGMRRKIQGFLTATGIWPFLFDGCYLTRDMLETIQKAGFSKVQAQRFYNPIDHIVFQLVTPSLKGVAEK